MKANVNWIKKKERKLKEAASGTFNPDREYDWYEDGDVHPFLDIFNDALDELGLWSEPSIQGGNGYDYFYTQDGDREAGGVDFGIESDFINNLFQEMKGHSWSEIEDAIAEFVGDHAEYPDDYDEKVYYPKGVECRDDSVDMDKALDYQYGTDRDKDNSTYTAEEKQRALNYWIEKTDSLINESLRRSRITKKKDSLNDNNIKCNQKVHESFDDELSRYQKWIDFDIANSHKVLNSTQQLLKKAGFGLVKDQKGNYQVVSSDKWCNLNKGDVIYGTA